MMKNSSELLKISCFHFLHLRDQKHSSKKVFISRDKQKQKFMNAKKVVEVKHKQICSF